jgi:catechol 2,3-dioxygenase-like lactoylglutathione lyase family enzyme
MFTGHGIHHIAIGVKDVRIMRQFYQEILEFNRILVDFPQAEYPALDEVIRHPLPVYIASLLYQEAGGIIVELIQMIDPVPRPIRRDFRYGDIGLSKITIPVADVESLYWSLKDRVNFCSGPKLAVIPDWGDYQFVYCRDPERNLIEFVASSKLPAKNRFGGIQWVGISVTDLERSILFYQKYGGFDITFINQHESFSDLVDEISGGRQTKVRSCVLANIKATGMIELFEVSEPRGRSTPFATRWGDFGYLQVCLNGVQSVDIFEIAARFEKEGIEFISSPKLMNDERHGAFFYMKDPDGIMVEFLNFLK